MYEPAPGIPVSGDTSRDVWEDVAGAPGWMRNRATGETYFDQAVYDSYTANQQGELADALTLRSTPTSSFSSSTSTSYSDPANLQLQRDQLAEQLRQNLADEARQQQLLAFNQDKFRVETELGNNQLALETQKLVQSLQMELAANALKREQMQQSLMLADREIQARASEGVANRNLTREGLAQQDASERARLGLERDRSIAEFAREPGDIGAVSAMLQRGGLSNISTALGQGENAITDRSLEPLASLLAPGPAAYQPRWETAQPYSPLNAAMAGGTVGGGTAGGVPARAVPPNVAPPAPLPRVQPSAVPAASGPTYLDPGGDPYSAEAQARLEQGLAEGSIVNADPALTPTNYTYDPNSSLDRSEEYNFEIQDGNLVAVPAMAHGGYTRAPLFVTGDAPSGKRTGNEEIISNPDRAPIGVTPTRGSSGDGGQMRLLAEAMRALTAGGMTLPMQARAHEVQTMAPRERGLGEPMIPTEQSPKGRVPRYAAGTMSLNSLLEQARSFMSRTGQTALSRSGFNAPPTPIGLSAPGTSPWLRRLGAATTATTRGIPQEVFLNELMNLIPQATPSGVMRRTR